MSIPHSAWVIAGAGLCAVSHPASAVQSTGTIVRVTGDQYTVDAGKEEGVTVGQELVVLKNGDEAGRLSVLAVRDHESDATAMEVLPGRVLRLGDTVTYEATGIPPLHPAPSSLPSGPPESPELPAPAAPASPEESPRPSSAAAPPPVPNGPTGLDLQEAGPEEERIQDALMGRGFENVFVRPTAPGGVYVEFENRRYRWEVEGLGEVMRAVADFGSGTEIMTVVGKARGVPIYEVRVAFGDFREYLAGALSDAEFRARLTVTWPGTQGHRGVNKSFGRVDATLGRGLRLSLVSTFFTPPADPQALIRLGVETDLFKGLRAGFREWVPLNRSAAFPEHPTVDRAEMSYLRKLGTRLYGTVVAGTFEEGRSAVRGEGTYFLSPNASLTGQVARVGRGLSDLSGRSYLGTFRYRLPKVDADVYARAGKFVYGDTGSSVGFVTRFREREYEFNYTKTDIEKNLSFTLKLPLGGPVYPRPRALRFRQEREFRFRYFSKASTVGRPLPEEGFAENQQLANMPGTLPLYVAFLKGRETEESDPLLVREMRDVPASEILGPSLSGSTGLWFVPAAEVVPYGYWVLGANWVSNRYRHTESDFNGRGTMAQYFTFGALPDLEITLRITNLNGRLGAQKYFIPSKGNARGYNIDRMVSFQYRLWGEKGNRPAVLVGGQDVAGQLGEVSRSVQYKAYYGMLTKHIAGFGLHAGLGTDYLKGFLVGVDRRVGGRMQLIVDHQRGTTTPGARIEAIRNVRADVYFPGLKTFGAGLSYTRRM